MDNGLAGNRGVIYGIEERSTEGDNLNIVSCGLLKAQLWD
jgi:hypothetical protein